MILERGPENANHAARQREVALSQRELAARHQKVANQTHRQKGRTPSTEPNRLPQQQLITGATVPACIQGMAAGQVPDGQRIGFGP